MYLLPLLLMAACNSSTPESSIPTTENPVPLQQPITYNGVDTSGGGNLLYTNEPATPENIASVLTGKSQVNAWIYYVNASQHPSFPFRPQIYSNLPQIQNLILNRKLVYISNDLPCRDKNNKAVDASIYAPAPSKICVSVPRLMERKISKEKIESWVSSLIVHEISHLVDFNENEAQAIEIHFRNIAEEIVDYTPASLTQLKSTSTYIEIMKMSLKLYNDDPTLKNDVLGFAQMMCRQLKGLSEKAKDIRTNMLTYQNHLKLKNVQLNLKLETTYYCDKTTNISDRKLLYDQLTEELLAHADISNRLHSMITFYEDHWNDMDLAAAITEKYSLFYQSMAISIESLYSCEDRDLYLGTECTP